MLEYKIVEKDSFCVTGISRRFNVAASQKEIPLFWDEHLKSALSKRICGTYGICYLGDGMEFSYMIADDYNPNVEIPEGAEVKTFPASTWAVFPCRGALPQSIQQLDAAIRREWIPAHREFEVSNEFDIEYYPESCDEGGDYCEIWLSVAVRSQN